MRIAAITREPGPGQTRPRSRDAGPRALGRALEVLESLARRRDGATLSGLSQRLGSPKSSLLYLLRPMARLGYLVRSADGRYQLGPAAFTLAMAALSNRELPQLARPFLEDLAEKSGETALLATMASDEPVAVYIDKVDGRDPIRYTPPLGLRRPLYCSAIGKLLLAHLPPTRRQEYLRTTKLRAFTAQTPVTRSALRRAIEEIRAASCRASWASEQSQPPDPVRRVIAKASRAAGLLAGVAVLVLAVLISFDVLMRYFLDRPQLFVDEIGPFLLLLVVFGGAAQTFRGGGHVRVDLVTTHLPPTARAWLRVFNLALGIVFLLAVIWVTTRSALTALHYGRVSAVMLYPLWLPMLLIPAGLALMAGAMVIALGRQLRAALGPSAGRDEVPPSPEAR